MRSNKTSFPGMKRGDIRPALEAVRISSNLIAFYPRAMHRAQPYVILLDPHSGILKRLELRPARLEPRTSAVDAGAAKGAGGAWHW